MIRVHEREGEVSVAAIQQLARGRHRVLPAVTCEQVGEDLRVGVGAEGDARLLQLLAEGEVVLEDAVVHDGHDVRRVRLRVCIDAVGRAVRGPARVADAGAAGQRGGIPARGEIGDAPAVLLDAQRRSVVDGHACRVVAPVAEQADALHEDGQGLRATDVADDAAHERTSWDRPGGRPIPARAGVLPTPQEAPHGASDRRRVRRIRQASLQDPLSAGSAGGPRSVCLGP